MKKGKCIDCNKNKAAKHRTICNTCKSRRYFANNMVVRIYHNLKNNAKRRNKFFDLSFDYFSGIVSESGYLHGRGRTPQSLSIDCIKNHLGYTKGNIQVVTLSYNASKGVKPEDVAGIYIDSEVYF